MRVRLQLYLVFHNKQLSSFVLFVMDHNRGGAPYRPSVRSPPTLTNVKSATQLPIDTSSSYINTLACKNFQKYEVIVESQQLQVELKCIQWRSKTEFPIVKVLFYKMLQKKLLGECSVVQVAIENFPSNLQTLPNLTLPQGLYLMKEALIGFQRLFDRFGSFDPSSRMVLINKNGKCRVWINQNITLNFPARRAKFTQRQFLLRVMALFQGKCIKTTFSLDFFNKISVAERFVQTMHILESFIKNYRIVLPNKLNLIGERNSAKKNGEKVQHSLDRQEDILNCGSLKKIPKFILQLRQEKKLQEGLDTKSFDSPKKRQGIRDRSVAKTAINANKKGNDKSDLGSQSKSNISPVSQISQDNKQTKSNNQKPSKPNQRQLRPAVRQLLKQNSQQVINTYATMHPISTQNYSKTDQKLPDRDGRCIDLTLTKLPQRSQKKPRKLSNEQSPTKKMGVIQKQLKVNNIKQQCSVLCSQQTATTMDETQSTNRKLTNFIQKPIQMNLLTKTFQTNNEECAIFQKNGWLKRMNTLTSDNLRDTVRSQHQGQQTFSQDYLLAGQQLGLLGNMGKQLKGSIIHHDTKL